MMLSRTSIHGGMGYPLRDKTPALIKPRNARLVPGPAADQPWSRRIARVTRDLGVQGPGRFPSARHSLHRLQPSRNTRVCSSDNARLLRLLRTGLLRSGTLRLLRWTVLPSPLLAPSLLV